MMRVAIVGQAWRTPLGKSIPDAVGRLLAGERAATTGPRTAGYAVQLAAPILDEPARSKQAKYLRRMGLFGLEVAHEALAAAGGREALSARSPGRAGDRVGLFSGVGGLRAHWDDMLQALENQSDDGAGAWERGLRGVHPYWMLRHLSNNVHALAAIELGLRGEGATYGGATGGAQALAAAARALHDRAIDAALVVTYDSLLEPETLVELGARRAATLETDPSKLAPAYDVRAAGFVPGEAAAAVVLVREQDATAPLAFVAAVDGADGEREEPRVHTLARLAHALVHDPDAALEAADSLSGMKKALGTDATGPAYAFVDGAARAWPDRDAAERAALGDLVANDTPLTAITAAMGQLGAATAVVQAIALGELLRRGAVPPIAQLLEAAAGPLVPTIVAAGTGAGARGSLPTSNALSTAIPGSSVHSSTALALSTGAPGLAAAIRVEVPR